MKTSKFITIKAIYRITSHLCSYENNFQKEMLNVDKAKDKYIHMKQLLLKSKTIRNDFSFLNTKSMLPELAKFSYA